MARIAISGLGRMGARHIEAVMKSNHQLAWLHDPFENPFALTPELKPLHVREMGEVVDVLIIATTADLHYPLAKQAILHGFKRIIIEKPVTQSHAQAVKLAALAHQHKVRLIVNHGRRYDENYQHLKTLGDLRSINLRFGGGGLGCVGTHWLDLCNFLFESLPISVNAALTPTNHNQRGTRFEDAGGSVHLLYPNHKRAFIEIGDDIGFIGGANFCFEKSQISWQREDETWEYATRHTQDLGKPNALYGLPLARETWVSTPPNPVTYAIAAINDALSDKPPLSGIGQAIDTMAVFAAAKASHTQQKRISLPLTLTQSRKTFAIP